MMFSLLATPHWPYIDGYSKMSSNHSQHLRSEEAATVLQVVQLIDCGHLHWRGQQLMENVTSPHSFSLCAYTCGTRSIIIHSTFCSTFLYFRPRRNILLYVLITRFVRFIKRAAVFLLATLAYPNSEHLTC
jgi:hypothetical protein